MNLDYKMKLATAADVLPVWKIMQYGIEKRKLEGSTQWQDGYPNVGVLENDVLKHEGYVVVNQQDEVFAYVALSAKPELAYEELKTGWLTMGQPYMVLHRLVVTQTPKIKGLAFWVMQQAEHRAAELGIASIKVDTNFDNAPMLAIFKKLDYIYSGEVYYEGSPRMAFEKVVSAVK